MLLGLLRRDGTWRRRLTGQIAPQAGERILTFGQADARFAQALRTQEPECDVVDLPLGRPLTADPHDQITGADSTTVWIESDISDEAIKPFRPFGKAVGIFPIRGLSLHRAKQLFSVVRHGLPAGGELHVIEFAASKATEGTVGDLFRKAGFKLVERTSAVPTLLGVVELYKALKQPPLQAEGPTS